MIPELEQRWENVTSVELSDRSSRSEIELVRETASQYDAMLLVYLLGLHRSVVGWIL
ncbi:MAG: hypothetical protein CM1200mP25_3120 [Acidobacteriota bacterium]|nr:MAG: hypothetical protein CM1200mP25_3120 [Acidobacteriota bacterium]